MKNAMNENEHENNEFNNEIQEDLPIYFVLFEWIRSFIFTGFPWNLSGYSLAFSDELIQTASLGGTYLLSLLAVLTFSVLGTVNKKSLLPSFIVVVLVWAIICGELKMQTVNRLMYWSDLFNQVFRRL